MRVVLDTNVLISSLGWKGPEYLLMQKILNGDLHGFISPSIIEEFMGVTTRNKFDFTETEVKEFIEIIISSFEVVLPREKVEIVLEDPKDNIIIECALESKANIIVIGDRHLLSLRNVNEIRIMKASELLDICSKYEDIDS